VNETIHRFTDLLEYLLPLYRREGKSYLTIGIGCTGGRHRSVMVAESLGKALNQNGFEISVSHRDVKK
jgi:RNase adapter protein RapZ